MPAKRRNDFGAAEMVGVLMLIAIFAVVVGVLAVMFFSTPPPEKIPAVKLAINNQSGPIKLYHEGGDPLSLNDTKFYLYTNDSADRKEVTFTGAGTDNILSAGEVLDYTVTPPSVPTKVDVVYTGGQWRGTAGYLVATLLLGNPITSTQTPGQDVTYFTINATTSGVGTISPSGRVPVKAGFTQSFTIQNSSSSVLSDVSVDNTSVLGGCTPVDFQTTSCTISNVAADHTIIATFVSGGVLSYWINVTEGPGGVVSPNGTRSVQSGKNQTLNFMPAPGYLIGSVVVDGTPQIPVPSNYTFTNVTTSHTLGATFTSNFTPGVIANYYLGQTWTTNASTNIASRIHFADASSGYASDVADWPNDYISRTEDFSVNFTGFVRISKEDDYTFYLTSDDGSWMNLNGVQIINNGGLHAATTVTAMRHLTPGYYSMALPMYENTGQAVAWLEYSSPNITRTFDIPLYHSAITIPSVSFTGAPVSGYAPLTVQFNDTSLDATTWMWDFGDNSTPSYLQNPSHTYSSIGTYNVTLVAANSFGSNMLKKVNYITAGSYVPGLTASYYHGMTWTTLWGQRTDSRIRFADREAQAIGEVTDEVGWPESMTGTGWNNSFSVLWDGYLHIAANDTYTFSLRSDDGSQLAIDESVVISDLVDHSPTTYTGSKVLGPGYHHIVVKMYENGGQAVALLQYTNTTITTPQLVTDLWHVAVVYPPAAGFTGSPITGNAPLGVSFKDLSTNSPTSWVWNFGDGNSTDSAVQNPVHWYTSSGAYNVSLTATNAGGSGTFTIVKYVNVSPALPVVIFSGSPTTGGVPRTVTFTDSSTNSPTAWHWDFGDGTAADTVVPNSAHLYSAAGIYNVSLTVTNAGGSNSSTLVRYIYANPTITSSAGAGGTLSPAGPVNVTYGTNQTFTVTPNTGYHVSDVQVDGVSKGAITSYAFTNVTAAHTIAATFTINSYTITATAGANGVVSPAGTISVNYGSNQSFAITPDTGYSIASVVVDGVSQGTLSVYTFTNITASHTINATFAIKTFTISPSVSGGNGGISPGTNQTVNYGATPLFTFTPNTGYSVASVTVDGIGVTPSGNTYTFPAVITNHSIVVTYAINTFKITPSVVGGNGGISPGTVQTVNYGATPLFTFTPNTGYSVASVTVDGIGVTPTGNTYTFPAVTADHSIVVTYAVSTFKITPSVSGGNGGISPGTVQTVNYGDTPQFTFTPNTGYSIGSVKVDGIGVTPTGNTYTFPAVTADHSIVVTYAVTTFTIAPSVSGGNGGISPGTVQTVNYGSTPQFTFSPNAGYMVDVVTVDSIPVTPTGNTYTFPAVTANHGIQVTFKWLPPTVVSILPTSGKRNNPVSITNIAGTNFQPGATVKFSSDAAGTLIVLTLSSPVVTSTKITGTLNIPSGQTRTTYFVWVTNTDSQFGRSATAIFTITN